MEVDSINWIDLVYRLAGQENNGGGEAHQPGRVLVGTSPAMELRRRSKRARGAAAAGSGYDPTGTILLSATQTSTDVIYADETFLTQAVCAITLPKACHLTMRPRKPGLFQPKSSSPGAALWKMDSDLPDAVLSQLQTVGGEAGREQIRFYTVRLLPGSETEAGVTHQLIVETELLPDKIDGFCVLKDYYPVDEAGRRMSDQDAAMHLLKSMLDICASVVQMLDALAG